MSFSNPAQLHFYLDSSFSMGQVPALNILLAFSKVAPERLRFIAEQVNKSIELEETGERIYKIRLAARRRRVQGWLVVREDLFTFYIEPSVSSTLAGEVSEKWVASLFPTLSFARLEPEQLVKFLSSLADMPEATLVLHDYVLKRKPGRHTTKRWVAGDRFDEATLRRKIRQEEKILHGIHFSLTTETGSFRARISVDGHLVYYGGEEGGFPSFHRLVIADMARAAYSRRRALENRDRRIEEGQVIVSPLVYSVTHELTSSQLRDVTDTFEQLSSYSVSVFHRGNPWLFMNVIDRDDGTTCDIYGFQDHVQIIPLNKATPESLSRISDLISEVVVPSEIVPREPS